MHVKGSIGKSPLRYCSALLSVIYLDWILLESPQIIVKHRLMGLIPAKIHVLKDAGQLFWVLPWNAVLSPCQGSPAAAVAHRWSSLLLFVLMFLFLDSKKGVSYCTMQKLYMQVEAMLRMVQLLDVNRDGACVWRLFSRFNIFFMFSVSPAFTLLAIQLKTGEGRRRGRGRGKGIYLHMFAVRVSGRWHVLILSKSNRASFTAWAAAVWGDY